MTAEENKPEENKAIALGLLFGVVGGSVFGPMIFDDTSTGISVGISLGLVYGAAFSHYKKGLKPTESADDDSNS